MPISGQTYDDNHRFLRGLSYRMTGNVADAEEIVQEVFVKALEKPPTNTQEPLRPWLVTVAMNLSRDVLRHRRRREYTGPWLPSKSPTEDIDSSETNALKVPDTDSPAARYDLMESVSIAFLIALEALTPAQRAVLLLRDVFDYSTSETARALGMKETNVKVTLHRARGIMHDYDKVRAIDSAARCEMTQKVLERFLGLLASHDVQGLAELLTEDVTVISDGGGEVSALLTPMQGREKMLRLILNLNQQHERVTRTSLRKLNAEPAVLVERSESRLGHATRFTMHCDIDESGRIRRLNFVFSPSKLVAIDNQVAGGMLY
jgi:RNA polymerase sigma-70 factor (ECF subfamily)